VSTGVLAIWMAVVVLWALLFLRFVRAKTDGEWKWRWGGRE
jgi:hypothetical protein